MKNIVYLNGEFIAKENAKVSVLDRGFLFGDSIYEVIPVYHAHPFRLSEHLDRLNYCLTATSLTSPYNNEQWQSLIEQVIEKNGSGHLSIYIQVTRGNDNQRNHVADKSTTATVLIMAMPLSTEVAELLPIKATLMEDFRWQHCDIKTTSLLGNVLLRQQADQLGFDEAILHRDNQITEATASNVFILKNNEIITPQKNHHILAGITRDLVVEIAEKASIKVHQARITTTQLVSADEIWISSSSREISPVVAIDDKIIADGKIGSMTKKVHSLFQVFKQSLIN